MKTNWKNGNYYIMSKKATDLIVDYSEKTGNKTVLPVFVALCYHANKNRECFPGYARIKKVSGITSSTSIAKAIKILSELGVVSVKKIPGKGNFYQINEEMTCSTNEHKECIYKNDHLRTHSKNGVRGVREINQWIKTIAPIIEEFKGNAIVPYERRILEQLLRSLPGEEVIARIEEAYFTNPSAFKMRGYE